MSKRDYTIEQFRDAARRVKRLLLEAKERAARDETDDPAAPESRAYLAALTRAANYMDDVYRGVWS